MTSQAFHGISIRRYTARHLFAAQKVNMILDQQYGRIM
jgi:hypothetical protein